MLITKIEPQKKNKNRANLYLDGNFACSVSLETAVKCRLKEGLELEKQELDNIISESEKNGCFNSGLKYISKKMCAEKEMRAYLNKKGFSENAVDFAIEKLTGYNYLNDAEYLKAYLNYSRLGKGILKIRYDLKNKGIDENLIDEGLETVKNGQYNACLMTAEKYTAKKEINYKTKMALYRFLILRGFENEVVNSAVKTIFNGDEDNNE